MMARDRGNLPQFMEVSKISGEEHFKFSGRLIFSVGADLLSKWLLGGNKASLKPTTGVVMVAEDRGARWIMDRARIDKEKCEDLFGEKLLNADQKMNIFARAIDFYNPGRETGAEKAFAHVERRHNSDVLTFLDASASEVGGMIHACALAHVRCDDGFSTRTFLTEVPMQKTEVVKKKETDEPEKNLEQTTKEAQNAALLWQLQHRHA